MTNIPQSQQKDIKIALAGLTFFDYCKIVDDEDFYNEKNAPYLKEICDALQEFENDDNEAIIITEPPRHGKTRTVGNDYVQWLLGRNPKYKIMFGAYNTQLSRRTSKIIRNKIGEINQKSRITFNNVFPKSKLKYGSTSVDFWGMSESDENNFLAIAPNSTSTGIGCDFLILDDTIKNKYEAYHKELKRQIFEDWFRDTIYSRLEGKRKIIICMTRWATDDMAGRLMEMLDEQHRKYRLITKKAFDKSRVNNEEISKDFKNKYNIVDFDQLANKIESILEEDKDLAYYYLDKSMLNPNQLNYKQYQNILQTIGEDIVEANYNQTPVDLKGCLYSHFLEYNTADIKNYNEDTKQMQGTIEFIDIRARADVADQGADYLCMIIYGVTRDKQAYVLDVYYTQDGGEITEVEAAKRLSNYNVNIFRPESNNGGYAWSRAVEKEYKKLGGTRCIFKPYTQTKNKEARILSNSTEVMNRIHFPMDWKYRYREYYISMKEYQRQGKNEHDDAEDCTTSIAEELSANSGIRVI